MCSKVLNGHIILTDTSITTILAPEMTYTPKKPSIRMRRVGGFLTCNDWNVENIWQLTCVKPIPDRYDFYCMPFVFRHIVRSPCYQQQVFTFQFLCRLQGFQFPLTGLGVRDIIRPLFEESSNDLANTNPLFVVIGKRYFSFSMFIVLHKKYAFIMIESIILEKLQSLHLIISQC